MTEVQSRVAIVTGASRGIGLAIAKALVDRGDRVCITGRNAEPSDAGYVMGLIRGTMGESYGDTVAHSVRIQYGGSVKPDNARTLMSQPDIDGALVGGASLDPDDFSRIVQYRLAAV